MNDSQHLDSATDMMKTTHLQDSQSDTDEIDAPDINNSSGTDERPSLTNLAGELQDLIITKLHPSSLIALSQTNHHFHDTVSLHRLPFPVVFAWLLHKENNYWYRYANYACYTCLRLKPQSAFGKKQTRWRRGKWGQDSYMRRCLDCGLSSCIDKGYATVLNKGYFKGYYPGRKSSVRWYLQKRVWEATSKASGSSGGSSHSVTHAFAMDEIKEYYGMMASSEWYHGPVDV